MQHPLLETNETQVDFLDQLRGFSEFGRQTEEVLNGDIPYFVNEYWTSEQRRSHALHEISYRACFKAQLPAFFIQRLTRPGDTVHDPFMGRGTTPIEAALLGRDVIGNDVNPLSTMLARPRTVPMSVEKLQETLAEIDWQERAPLQPELEAFYHPVTLSHLEQLKGWITGRVAADGSLDPTTDWIRMIALNRLSGHSPGFFSGRSMPPNQAVSLKSQLRINAKLGVTPPQKDVAAIILKKAKSLLRQGAAENGVRAQFFTGAADETHGIEGGSVDLIVTSPPFLDVVNYAADNWLRCWFAGIDPAGVNIAMLRTQDAWSEMVHDVLREQARILRPGGHVAFEVGEVRGGKVLLERLVWAAAEGLPFERLGVMVNDQDFTKTANCWGISNGTKGTNSNRIVLLRRS